MAKKSSKTGIIIGITGGLGLLWYLTRRPAAELPAPTIVKQSNPAQRAETAKITSVAAMTEQKKASIEHRKDYLRMQNSGFTSLAMSDKTPFLNYKTQIIVRHCHAGDYDIIEHDLLLTGRSEKNLVFSLESLSPNNRDIAPQKQLTSLSQLKAGTQGQFKLQPGAKPEVYGLFLCSFNGDIDQKKATVCSHLQPEQHLGELIPLQKAALASAEKKSKYPQNDKLYFLQLLVAGPGGVYIYEDTKFPTTRKTLMEKALQLEKYPYLRPALDRGVKLVGMIASMAPIVANNQVTLSLPYRGDCPYVDH